MGFIMKKLLISILIVFLLTSCATPTGKYMQMRHPISNEIVAQITLPSASACETMIDLSGDKIAHMFSCSPTSWEAGLMFRTTLKNVDFNYVIDLDTIGRGACEQMVDRIIKYSGENYEIVSECSLKG